MVFNIQDKIQRAEEHIISDDDHRLPYACLELRMALETIAYSKLSLRDNNVSEKELAGWQPKRVIETLMEYVDERIDEDSFVKISKSGEEAGPGILHVKTKGVSPKEIGRYWQKLGAFLHERLVGLKMASTDNVQPKDFLKEVLAYVDGFAKQQTDFHIAETLEFPCTSCGQKVVRNIRKLDKPGIAQCPNPNCDASFVLQKEGGLGTYATHTFSFACPVCKKPNRLPANQVLKIEKDSEYRTSCSECKEALSMAWIPKVWKPKS
jgi:hypothetical protein